MKKWIKILVGISIFFSINLAWGDATIETSFKTGGFKGMGASEGISIRRYQGDRKWESSSLRFTGAFLSKIAGGGENTTITRIDRGVYWTLDPKNQTYTEHPILLPKVKEGKPDKTSQAQQSDETPKVRITKSEFTVKKTGASETINGFPCEEYSVIWLLEIEDIQTKAKSQSIMTTNLWTTPEAATIRKAQTEEQKFELALLKKLGSDISQEEAKQMGLAVFASMSGASENEIKKGLSRVKNEMSKIKGYPIRTIITWVLEGEEGKISKETAQKDESIDISGGVGGLLSGLAGRMVQKKAEEKMDSKGAPFFNSTIEVKSININQVSADTFEIPVGYTRK